MNQKHVKSPYLTSVKRKQATFFPRIHKAPPCQGTRLISNSMGKKGCEESIFKLKEDSLNDKVRHIDDDRVYHSKYYKQLESEILDMEAKFHQEIAQIQQKKTHIQNAIKNGQKNNYDNKLSMWELRNQILELQRILEEEKNQNAQILYDLGENSEVGGEDALQGEEQQQFEASPVG